MLRICRRLRGLLIALGRPLLTLVDQGRLPGIDVGPLRGQCLALVTEELLGLGLFFLPMLDLILESLALALHLRHLGGQAAGLRCRPLGFCIPFCLPVSTFFGQGVSLSLEFGSLSVQFGPVRIPGRLGFGSPSLSLIPLLHKGHRWIRNRDRDANGEDLQHDWADTQSIAGGKRGIVERPIIQAGVGRPTANNAASGTAHNQAVHGRHAGRPKS